MKSYVCEQLVGTHSRQWLAWEEATAYYARRLDERARGVWPSDRDSEDSRTTQDKSQSLEEWISSNGFTNLRQRKLEFFQHFPRIYRPGYRILDKEAAQQTLTAVIILVDRMEHIFRVIEPDLANLHAFGHEIRNLLLLASMEVEAAWSAILRENHYTLENNARFTTNDYVKLLAPLHLAEYQIGLVSYPRLALFQPFKDWDSRKPSQSIPWYQSYNKTKHNREGCFHSATLEHAINAVVAAVILYYAQFGPLHLEWPRIFDAEDTPLSRVFREVKRPEFPPEEWCLSCGCDLKVDWRPVDYSFQF